MLTLTVRDFGPLAEGCIRLRPLTLLVGPNNVGKSYLARLVYAILTPFLRPPGPGFRLRRQMPLRFEDEPRSDLFERDEILELLRRERGTTFREFPVELRQELNHFLERSITALTKPLTREVQRCFGSKLADLGRTGNGSGLALALRQDHPPFLLDFVVERHVLEVRKFEFDISDAPMPLWQLTQEPFLQLEAALKSLALDALLHSIPRTAYYFPAARSGILQGHKLLAAVWLTRLPLVGLERFDLPSLSGEAVDFISNLLSLQKRGQPGEFASVAKFLEEDICGGQIGLQPGEANLEYPEIYYQQGSKKFALHRTSSMVSELAPIVLFLKHLIRKGDLLVLEEPEAHLHPDNQRAVARAITKLVRKGVQILVTTHSDYFVHQISNFIRLSASRELGKSVGYGDDEYLGAEEVAAYLVCHSREAGASVVEELEVSSHFGIPEDEFLRIAAAINNESAALDPEVAGR
jgi:energy-coupling factor transporter ATP-binding protein EcfA2